MRWEGSAVMEAADKPRLEGDLVGGEVSPAPQLSLAVTRALKHFWGVF